MIRNNSKSVIAAAVFAALSTAAVAQTTSSNPSQSTGASQSSQTNPLQSVNPSAASRCPATGRGVTVTMATPFVVSARAPNG